MNNECYNCLNSFICKKYKNAKKIMSDEEYLNFISLPCSEYEDDYCEYEDDYCE